jgi:predicted secreted hydrolase
LSTERQVRVAAADYDKTLANTGDLQDDARSVISRFVMRNRSRTAMALLVGALALGPVSQAARDGEATDGGFRLALPGYQYRFPQDHGSHDAFRTEWWYYTGHLAARNGRRFGFQLTFFRRGVAPDRIATAPSRWTIRHVYLAHFALADLDNGRFSMAEKISRAGLGKAGADADRLRVWIDRWSVERLAGDPDRHRLRAAADEFAVDLTVTSLKPPVVHGTDGVSRKGDRRGQASHYYSLTRLATEGSVTVRGEQLAVAGTSWMDHEFGSADLGRDVVGWDWFSIQLSNNSELMVYRLRRADGSPDPASSGTLILADGRSQHLPGNSLRLEPLTYWTSPASGARYPQRWRLSCASPEFSLELTPLLADQELITRRSTQVTYWEGAVQATGTWRGAAVSGQGYVEMTGYAERVTHRL